MPDWSTCPHCGQPLAAVEDDPEEKPAPVIFAAEASRTAETPIPATHGGDDLVPGADGATFEPSPRNGAYKSANGMHAPAGFFPIPSSGSSEFDPLAAPVADPLLEALSPPDPPSEATPSPPPEPAGSNDERPATDWSLVLLRSYASAMTLAVAWLLWQGRGRSPRAAETLPAPAAGAAQKSVADLPAIAADRRVAIGGALTVGSIEFSPLAIRRGVVSLRSRNGRGGETPGCFLLSVRIRNVSKDDAITPLDRESVRRSDAGEAPSTLAAGDDVIGSYPLALASELSIRDQRFATLKPGETLETLLATEAWSGERLGTDALWRVPVRVTPDRVVMIGVEIRPEDVR